MFILVINVSFIGNKYSSALADDASLVNQMFLADSFKYLFEIIFMLFSFSLPTFLIHLQSACKTAENLNVSANGIKFLMKNECWVW